MIVGLLSNVEYLGLGSIDGHSPSGKGSIQFIHHVLYLLCCLCNKSQVIGILYIPDASGCWCLVPKREEQSPSEMYSMFQPPPDISIVSFKIMSMTQLKRSGERTQPCLTLTFHIEILQHPSVVLTWQHISGYMHLSNDVRQIVGDLIPLQDVYQGERSTELYALVRSTNHRCAGVWYSTAFSTICLATQIW